MADKNQIIEKVKKEYEEGKNFFDKYMSPKKDNEKYILGEKSNKKVHVRAILSILQTLYSMFYLDKRKVVFSAVSYSGNALANVFNILAEFDYKRMRKHIYDFLRIYYGFIFGVGITWIVGWDEKKNIPIIDNIPPLCAILDPYEFKVGALRRYFGVNKETTLEALKADQKYTNLADIKLEDDKNQRVKVYHHYTKYNGKVYLTSWANNMAVLIRFEEFTFEQKGEDFGVSIFQPYPMPGKIGADIIDLGAEYQIMLSQVINLLLLQAKKDVLGEDRLVDINKVDFKDIQTPSVGGKNIPVELEVGENISNVIHTIPKEQSNYKAESGIQILRGLLQESTSMPEIVQGITPDKQVTKGEVQQLQLNANSKFNVISSFLLLADEDFWKSYQRVYRTCFKGEKNISIKSKYGDQFSIITKDSIEAKDFIEFNVVVESQIEKKIKNTEKFNQYTVLVPMSLQYMGEYEQLTTMREYWELASFDQDIIEDKFPMTVDEMRAKQHLILLNENKPIPAPEPGEDHRVYLKVYSQGVPTAENRKAVMLRQRLMRFAPKPVTDNSNMQNMQNIAQAQAGNRLAQNEGEKNNIVSNQDINV